MGCRGRRVTPRAVEMMYPMVGESGLMLLEYVGEDPPRTWYGEVTNAPYPFDENRARYVDARDAVYLLGPDFVEC